MRLTKQIREDILDSIIHKKLGARHKHLNSQMEKDAFHAIVDHGIKAAGFSKTLFENPQAGLFEQWGTIRVNSKHNKWYENFSRWTRGGREREYVTSVYPEDNENRRYIPSLMGRSYHDDRFDYEEGDIPEVDAMVDEGLALEKEYQDIKREVMSVLNGVTTLKKLLEVWPESKPFLPNEVYSEKPKPPAVITDNVNKLLNL